MNETTPAPDRAEIEKRLSSLRGQIATCRQRLDRITQERRHLYRRESIMVGTLADLPDGESRADLESRLVEVRAELAAMQQGVEALESEIDNLQSSAMEHVEAIEIKRRMPGIVADLEILWSCSAQRGRFAPSLPSYAADLLRDRLDAAGEKYMSGEADLDACAARLKRKYRI